MICFGMAIVETTGLDLLSTAFLTTGLATGLAFVVTFLATLVFLVVFLAGIFPLIK